MDQNMKTGFDIIDAALWMGTCGILLFAHVTRTDITFFMGLLVSILASIYYVVSIIKSIKSKK